MCEQFKRDFVNKVINIIDSDLVHKLKGLYDIEIVPCKFSNTPGCKGLAVYDRFLAENYSTLFIRRSICCSECNCYICGECIKYKFSQTRQMCIDCYIPKALIVKHTNYHTNYDSYFWCKLCLSEEVHTSSNNDNVYYCKQCNSFSSFHYSVK
jgi:hypothetical protein